MAGPRRVAAARAAPGGAGTGTNAACMATLAAMVKRQGGAALRFDQAEELLAEAQSVLGATPTSQCMPQLVTALVKLASQYLQPGCDARTATALTRLACLALQQWTSALGRTPTRDALLLHYHCVRRMLLAGQLLPALEQGHGLVRVCAAIPAGGAEVEDVRVAAALHVTVCVSELAGQAGAEVHGEHIETWAACVLPPLAEELRLKGTQEARQHMESLFKCLYKVVVGLARGPLGSGDGHLLSDVVVWFMRVAGDVGQAKKLPQYASRLLADVHAAGTAPLVLALAAAVAGSADTDQEARVACLEVALQAAWAHDGVAVLSVIRAARWHALLAACPGLAAHFLAAAAVGMMSQPDDLTCSMDVAVSVERGLQPLLQGGSVADAVLFSGLRLVVEKVHDVAASGEAAERVLAHRPGAGAALARLLPPVLLCAVTLAAGPDGGTNPTAARMGHGAAVDAQLGLSALATALRLLATAAMQPEPGQSAGGAEAQLEAAAALGSRWLDHPAAGWVQEDGPDVAYLSSLAATLGKALAAAGQQTSARSLLRLAWVSARCKARVAPSADEVATVEKRGRAWVAHLSAAGLHMAAVEAAQECALLLCQLGVPCVTVLYRLVHLHVTSRLACVDASRSSTAVGALRDTGAAPDPGPPPPSKGGGRGRLRGMKSAAGKAKAAALTLPDASTGNDPVPSTAAPPLLTEWLAATAGTEPSVAQRLDWVGYEEARQYQRNIGAAAERPGHIVNRLGACLVGAAPPGTPLQARGVVLAHLLREQAGVGAEAGSAAPMQVDGALEAAAETLAAAVHYARAACISDCAAAAVACTLLALRDGAAPQEQEEYGSRVLNNSRETPGSPAAADADADRLTPAQVAICQRAASAPVGRTSQWLESGLRMWGQLTDALAHPEASPLCAPPQSVCLQLALQLWQLCHLQDHVGGVAVLEQAVRVLAADSARRGLGSAVANAAAVLLPLGRTCNEWARQCCGEAACPGAPDSLAGLLADQGAFSPEVTDVVDELKRARSLGLTREAADALIALHARAAAAPALLEAAGQAWLLLRVRLAQLASACCSQWGDAVRAAALAQEALRMAVALHKVVAPGAPDDAHEQAQVIAADPGNRPPAGEAITGHSPLPLLRWSITAAYLCSLSQAAHAEEALGDVESAVCLAQACAGASLAVSAWRMAAQATLHVATMAARQGRARAATDLLRACRQLIQGSNDPLRAASDLLEWRLHGSAQPPPLPSPATTLTPGTAWQNVQAGLLACRMWTACGQRQLAAGHHDSAREAIAKAASTMAACAVAAGCDSTTMAAADVHCVPWPGLQAQVLLLQGRQAVDATADPHQPPCGFQGNVGRAVRVVGLQPCRQEEPLEGLLARKLSLAASTGSSSRHPTGAAVLSSPSQLLRALQLSWGSASSVAASCAGALLGWAAGAGLPHAAAMFLNLTLGLEACAQLRACAAGATREDSPIDSDVGRQRDQRGEQGHSMLATLDSVLRVLSEAAAGGSVDRLEAAAAAWLHETVRQMPGTPAVVCLHGELQRPCAATVFICRFSLDAGPPLVLELGPGALALDTGGVPQPVTGLLSQLGRLLQDSAASMAALSSGAATAEGKAAWWQARTELDRRMAALLDATQAEWLGPWGCLLMSPLQAGDRERLLPHAVSIMAGLPYHSAPPRCRETAVELLVLLLAHGRSLQVSRQLGPAIEQLAALLSSDETDAAATAAGLEQGMGRLLDSLKPPADSQGYESRMEDVSVAAHDVADAAVPTPEVSRRAAVKPVQAPAPQAAPRRGTRAATSRLQALAAAATPPAPPITTALPATKRPSRCAAGARARAPAAAPTDPAPEPRAPTAVNKSPAPSTRPPLLLVLSASLHAHPWEAMRCLSGVEVYRSPGLLFSAACGARLGAASQPAGLEVDASRAYYLLNPGGDLRDTQASFEAWFAQELRWQGLAGKAPEPEVMAAALRTHQLFVYLGHGSGEQYLRGGGTGALRRGGGRCAANLLMGCSSGRLRTCNANGVGAGSGGDLGSYPPSGALMTYLMAGCPAVVANLWDVTDKDIDRYSTAVLKEWMGERGAELPRSSSTPQGISRAVSGCRHVCKLPHLIGAAPVCYGLPAAVVWGGPDGIRERRAGL